MIADTLSLLLNLLLSDHLRENEVLRSKVAFLHSGVVLDHLRLLLVLLRNSLLEKFQRVTAKPAVKLGLLVFRSMGE